MTYQTYYSWYRLGDLNQIFDFYNKDYDFPILNKIKIPVKIIVGEKDLFFYFQKFNKDVSEIEHILKQNIHKSDITIIKGCGHVFRGYESIVAKEIKDFL